MPFPTFAGKYAGDPFVTPADYVRIMRLEEAARVEGAILLYQSSLWRRVTEWPDARLPEGRSLHGLRLLGRTGDRVGVVGGFGVGAPAAAIIVEELVALGTWRILSVGTAGALQPDGAVGGLVLCTGAVRDEGVSHHYLPAEVEARPSPALTERLGAGLSDAGLTFEQGATWTIDAPYRETVAELRHYQAAGVRSVEMEAAAVFAVGHVREVEVAATFCYSDLLGGTAWEPHFGSPLVAAGLDRLLAAAVAALAT